MRKIFSVFLCCFAAFALISCDGRKAEKGERCVYYWKTTFGWSRDDWKSDFVEKYGVTKIYLRLFDVAMETNWDTGGREPMPIATTVFDDYFRLPEGLSVVPVVYITLDALKAMAGKEEEYAGLIAGRVLAMMEFNGLGAVEEVHLDCDWTGTTAGTYFRLCEKIRGNLPSDCALTSTIRLHQLCGEMPAVDRGVLMLYNTGSFTNPDESNSILSYDDVLPYVRKARCSIPLDFAYPTYTWGLLFKGDKFRCIIRRPELPEGCFERLSGETYVATKDCFMEGHAVSKGDEIRIENSQFQEIEKVKALVESRLGKPGYSTFIYHLDSLNLSKFAEDEIRKIYSLD